MATIMRRIVNRAQGRFMTRVSTELGVRNGLLSIRSLFTDRSPPDCPRQLWSRRYRFVCSLGRVLENPFVRNAAMMSSNPLDSAHSKAVIPNGPFTVASAPRLKSSRTLSQQPLIEDAIKGVVVAATRVDVSPGIHE
jgi:hypothetical protein